jgi:very-short-patch-repair endonuclease
MAADPHDEGRPMAAGPHDEGRRMAAAPHDEGRGMAAGPHDEGRGMAADRRDEGRPVAADPRDKGHGTPADLHDERPTRDYLWEPWDVRHVGGDQRPSVPLTGVKRDDKQVVGWPDREISAIGAVQQAIIAREQLLELGVGRGAINHAIARGRLHLRHRGVYSLVAPRALPPLAAERAAVLACGDGALISHHSAAAMWGIRPAIGGDVDVTVVGRDAGRRRPGICVHRVGAIDRREVRTRAGIALTSAARTLLDIAPRLSQRSLELAFDEALTRELTTIEAIGGVTARYPQRKGAARLRGLACPDRPTTVTRSEGEERFLAMLRRAGLPEPEVNARLGRFVADFLWRAERVVVEIDGYDYHRGRAAFERDHERDAEHQHDDFLVIRVTWRQLEREPEALLVRVATALERRRWRVAA